jgi:tetratricopeptide (TPR) repeat protein
VLGTAVTVACIVLTQQQVKYWRTDRTLFEHALSVTGNNPVAHYNLGVDFGEAGDLKSAKEHFQAVLKYEPAAYYNLGHIASLEGRDNDAIELYRATIRLKPWHPLAHLCLGMTLWKQGQRTEAIQEYEQAVQLGPDQFAAHYDLGVAYYAEGRIEDGQKQFAEAFRINPNSTEARERLAESPAKLLESGLIFVSQRKPKEAAAAFENAVKVNPDWPEALNNLAWLRATCWASEIRDGSEAVRLAERAHKIVGDKVPGFLGTLAAAYAEAGRFDDAVKTAGRAKDLAAANGQKEIAERNAQLLTLYRSGQPYHEMSPTPR